MPWKPRHLSSAELELSKDNHALQMALLNLRQQLLSKQTYADEVLLHERLERIDELNATLEQSRRTLKRQTDVTSTSHFMLIFKHSRWDNTKSGDNP